MGQPSYCSAANAGLWGERGYGDGSTPYAWLSCIALLPWLLQSSPLHPLDASVCSQHQPSPWDCSTVPKLQLLAAAPSRVPAFLSGVCMVVAKTVWFSFHLGCQRSAVSFSALNVSPLTQTVAPMWGSDPLFHFPHQMRAVSVLLTLLFSPWFLPPPEFCVGLCILSLWSGTPVHYQLVFCMHFCAWRCIPDVSVERDVLHIHLLLCHLVLKFIF